MADFKSLKSAVFDSNNHKFDVHALQLFKFQAKNNPIFQKYLKLLGVDPLSVTSISDIPFLPIQFFKNHRVVTGQWDQAAVFESSGTTGDVKSQHYIESLSYYHKISRSIFEKHNGPLTDYHIIALLPSYLENQQSSLIAMIKNFMTLADSPDSAFYLHDMEKVSKKLTKLTNTQTRKILLWGVSFALLDLAERYELDLGDSLVIATGGMKGRREEITYMELYQFLRHRWQVPLIHSEYGMTELMSQAYTIEEGLFRPPAWMRIMVREVNDPFSYCPNGRTGGINIIDLANVHSCAFIATDDLGLCHHDNSFEIFGRLDNSDQRGCNLMVSELID